AHLVHRHLSAQPESGAAGAEPPRCTDQFLGSPWPTGAHHRAHARPGRCRRRGGFPRALRRLARCGPGRSPERGASRPPDLCRRVRRSPGPGPATPAHRLAHLARLRAASAVGGILAGHRRGRADQAALPSHREQLAQGAAVAMTDMTEALTAVRESQRALTTVTSAVEHACEEDLGTPSLLPDWTRGHVLAHIDGITRTLARQLEYTARGSTIEVYDGGRAGRAAAIEAGATRSAAEHVAALSEAQSMHRRLWP